MSRLLNEFREYILSHPPHLREPPQWDDATYGRYKQYGRHKGMGAQKKKLRGHTNPHQNVNPKGKTGVRFQRDPKQILGNHAVVGEGKHRHISPEGRGGKARRQQKQKPQHRPPPTATGITSSDHTTHGLLRDHVALPPRPVYPGATLPTDGEPAMPHPYETRSAYAEPRKTRHNLSDTRNEMRPDAQTAPNVGAITNPLHNEEGLMNPGYRELVKDFSPTVNAHGTPRHHLDPHPAQEVSENAVLNQNGDIHSDKEQESANTINYYAQMLDRTLSTLADSQKVNKQLREEVRKMKGESDENNNLSAAKTQQQDYHNDSSPRTSRNRANVRITRTEYVERPGDYLDHCGVQETINIPSSADACAFCQPAAGEHPVPQENPPTWRPTHHKENSGSAAGDNGDEMEHVAGHVFALDHERSHARNKYNELKDRYNALLQRYREVKSEKKSLEDRIRQLEEEAGVSKLHDDREHESSIHNLRERINDMAQEISELRETNKEMEKSEEKAQEKAKKAEERAEFYRHKMEQTEHQPMSTRGFMSSPQNLSYAARLEAENEDLRSNNAQLTEKLDNIDRCHKRLGELKSVLRTIKENMTEHQENERERDESVRDNNKWLMKYQEQILEVVTGIRDTMGNLTGSSGYTEEHEETKSSLTGNQQSPERMMTPFQKFELLIRENAQLHEKCASIRKEHETGTQLITQIRNDISENLTAIKEALVSEHRSTYSSTATTTEAHNASQRVENHLKSLYTALERMLQQSQENCDVATEIQREQTREDSVLRSTKYALQNSVNSLESLCRDCENLRISLDRSAINLGEASTYHNDLATLMEYSRQIVARARGLQEDVSEQLRASSQLRSALKASRAEQLRLASELASVSAENDSSRGESSHPSAACSDTLSMENSHLKKENEMLARLCEKQQHRLKELKGESQFAIPEEHQKHDNDADIPTYSGSETFDADCGSQNENEEESESSHSDIWKVESTRNHQKPFNFQFSWE